MELSISVMAHPSRVEFFPYLIRKLGDVPFAIDEKGLGAWENCKRAWRMAGPVADWHVVIQDDAIVCDNFRQRAEEVILKAKEILRVENYICNFYYGFRRNDRGVAKKALEKGYWIHGYPKWGVAICMQTKFINEMIQFCEDLKIPRTKTADDVRIGRFIASKKMLVYFPMPSIIDHRSGKSLVGDPGNNRHAYKFIDEQK